MKNDGAGSGIHVPARGEKRLDALAAVLMAASEIALATEKGSDAEAEAAETADDAFALMTDESKHRAATPRGAGIGYGVVWTRTGRSSPAWGFAETRARSKRTCSRCRRSASTWTAS